MTTATTNKSWLGAGFSFDGVKDEVSSQGGGSGLLQAGLYKATITNAVVGVIGKNETPALTVYFKTESGKEITNNFWLTKLDDAEGANTRNLKNLLTHILYNELTEKEFKELDKAEVAERCTKALVAIAKNGKAVEKFIGKEVLIDVNQKPFISTDKDTKAIKWTKVLKSTVINSIPKALLKLIEEREEQGLDCKYVPQFAFTNDIKMYGVGFVNDFDADKKLYDTLAYKFVNETLKAVASDDSNDDTEPLEDEEISF